MPAVPFVPVLNTVSVETICLYNSQRVENVYHVHVPSELESDMNLIAAAVKTWWTTNVQPSIAQTVSLEKIVVKGMLSRTSTGIEYVTGLPVVGADNTQGLPNHCAIAVKWITGMRGRSFRGRTYHFGITTQRLSNQNTITAAYQTVLKNAYTALITDIEAITDHYMVVVSKMANKSWRVEGVTTRIVGCAVDTTMDSQRRRLPGRGE